MTEEYSGPKIVKFPERNIADISNRLRDIADELDAGGFGIPMNAVVVLDSTDLDIFLLGKDCMEDRAHWLLHAGAIKLIRPFLCEKGILPPP